MMIKTRHEYEEAARAVTQLAREDIPAERERLRAAGASARTIERLLGTMRARVAELRHAADLYERVTGGDLSMFRGTDELGQMLIAARLARGWTQREFARRLGVHESQVSRDERNDYHGITVERLQALAAALGLELRTTARLAEDVAA